MLSPTESPPASAAPRLAASISPGPPPVITVRPFSASSGRGLPAELVPAMSLGDSGRAEDRDPVLDLTQGVEPHLDLAADPVEALLVFRLDVDGGAQQLLVVPGQVPPPGFEPAPRGLKGRRSNQLSYRGEVAHGTRAHENP